MAWTEFYMQTTGSNLNSGSSAADAAAVTSTNGDWGNAAANRFTAAAGTPFAGVSVGDWASVFLDAASFTPYIAQVTAVNAGGASLDLSATLKLGTAPATGATGRSCKVGGAWADLGITAATAALTTGTVPTGMRVNVKAGTYANTSVNRALAMTATTAAMQWWRGYKATPGDMDGVPVSARVAGTDVPSFTFTTAGLTLSTPFLICSNLDVVGARTAGPQVTASGSNSRFQRVRVECTGANTLASAVQVAASGTQLFEACWFKATGTAARVFDANRRTYVDDCTFEGGGVGCEPTAASVADLWLARCIFRNNGSHGVRVGNAQSYLSVDSCTFSNPGGDGVRLDVVPTGLVRVANCLFRKCGGIAINNNSGAATGIVQRYNNAFYLSTSGNEFGLGDTPTFQDVPEVADPCGSDTDLTLVSGALSRAAASPGAYEISALRSYRDIGALQHQDAGGGTDYYAG